MNIAQYLAEDINFGYTPVKVMDYIMQKANSQSQYVSWLTTCQGELVVRTWGFRRTKSEGLEYTEVERKSIGSCVRKNCYLTSMSGYKVVYKPRVHASGNWYGYTYYNFDAADFNKWFSEPVMGICTRLLNPDYVFEIPKYKYCGYSGGCDLLEYLELYEAEPCVEYFGKLGIKPTKRYIQLAKKDKQFVRFIYDNAEDIRQRFYNVSEVIFAYQNHMSIEEAYKELKEKRESDRVTAHIYNIKKSGVDRRKVYRYIRDNNINVWTYNDYFKAITLLDFDLSDTKNVYPKDFQRMHDLRVNEYNARKAEMDRKEHEKLYEDFRQQAMKYKALEIEEEEYSIIIPGDVSDLKKEGEDLHHCVGKMGYDAKMARGDCIIAFVRMTKDKATAFVTVEYLTKTNVISQCYADHDSRPSESVIQFVNDWGKKVKKALKAEQKGA